MSRISRLYISIILLSHVCISPAVSAPLAEGKYVTVRDGHLSYNDKRIRFWGTNFVHILKRTGKDLSLSFDRIQDAGFNAVRVNLISNTFLSERDSSNPDLPANTLWIPRTVRGSGSPMDRIDQALYEAKQRGMFFWFSFDRGSFNEADYDALPDDGTREEWKEIVKHGLNTIIYIDRRAERTFQLYAKNLLEHVNPYTGKKYADEETIALWEILNECSFVEDLISSKHEGILEKRITQRWNEWLKKQYKTDDALKNAWGNLSPGESLEQGNVLFAPVRTNAKQITKAGVQHEYVLEQGGTTTKYPAARGEDVMRFAYDLYQGQTKRFIAFVRTLGKGIAQIPITPTGRYAASLHNYYAAGSCGDFSSMGVYSFNVRPWMMKDKLKDSPFYPYTVRSNEHPLMEQPIDLVRVPNRPALIYECNDFRPNPYAMEFWTRMALFASWQDYDGVFWFHWDVGGYLSELPADEAYAQSKLPMPDANYPNAGIVMANDEAALAGLKAAGTMFLTRGVKPAADPVTVTIGKDVLLDPFNHGVEATVGGANVSQIVRPYVWQKGMRTIFSLNKPTKLPPPLQYIQGHIQIGPNVVWDWNHDMGYVRIDTPSTKLYTGFLRPYLRFKGDVTLTHINRIYGTFAIVAQDGKPLEQSDNILIVAMSRSSNTYTNVYPERLTTEDYFQQGLAQQVQAGEAPKRIDRIGGELYAPWLKGKVCDRYTFARKLYRPSEVLTSDRLTLYEYEPIFYYRVHPKRKRDVKTLEVIGHSIVNHPPAEHLGWNGSWGMAATAAEKDFAHLLQKDLGEYLGKTPALVVKNCFEPSMTDLNYIDTIAKNQADVIVIMVGDNLPVEKANTETLEKPYENLILQLKKNNPHALIYCVSMWGSCPKRNALMKTACDRQQCKWINMDGLIGDEKNRAVSEGHFKNDGVNWHPGDRGMQEIAKRIWQMMQPDLAAE